MTLTLDAPAKVNLWLLVGPLRDDGFHDVDTLFCALELADTVSVDTTAGGGAGIRLEVDHAPPLQSMPELGSDHRNLAVQAATAMLDAMRRPRGLGIDLVKRIPPGGGLGGGSSDAGAVLRALDQACPGELDADRRQELAAGLGSDVPFFASGQALARGLGRGELLDPLPTLSPRTVVLALPHVHIATAEAYRWLDQDRSNGDAPPPPELGKPVPEGLGWDDIAATARNDFEAVVFRRYPELGRLRDRLAHHGASPALLAGSGSTVFGVFDDEAAAATAAEDLRSRFADLFVVTSRTRPR